MNKALAIMAIITIALSAYALATAQLPPASISYKEVFYINNQSVTFVTKDGFGLFAMHIEPRVNSFNLRMEFPKGTTYLIRYGNKEYHGTNEFQVTVNKDTVPTEVYVQFQLPPELIRKLVYENGEAKIIVRGDKAPIWHAEDTVYIKYRKEKK
ncbi:hypothetical protein [Thermococcus sp.]|uniref:hypothetical protein n=1 Tax=Thermococcus sp. TaxID=35749 RepID=UPI002638E359|nr:hypothetical protein [Thermococcus sp.]